MMAWLAFCNMLRAAARDPVWAMVTLIMSPIRAGKYLIGVIIVGGTVLIVLISVADLLAKKFGFTAGGILHTVLTYGGALITDIALFRMLTNPLIQHFGNQQSDDTHGTARFATNQEISSLTYSVLRYLLMLQKYSNYVVEPTGPTSVEFTFG